MDSLPRGLDVLTMVQPRCSARFQVGFNQLFAFGLGRMGCLRSLGVPSLCAEHMASWAGKLSAGERAESRNLQACADLKASEKEI